MQRFPKPWYRSSRKSWFVTLDGQQHDLGPDRQRAFDEYRRLLAATPEQRASSDLVAFLVDRFLD